MKRGPVIGQMIYESDRSRYNQVRKGAFQSACSIPIVQLHCNFLSAAFQPHEG